MQSGQRERKGCALRTRITSANQARNEGWRPGPRPRRKDVPLVTLPSAWHPPASRLRRPTGQVLLSRESRCQLG